MTTLAFLLGLTLGGIGVMLLLDHAPIRFMDNDGKIITITPAAGSRILFPWDHQRSRQP